MLYTYTFCTIIYKTIERTAEIIYLFRNGKRSMEYSNDLHIHRVKAIKNRSERRCRAGITMTGINLSNKDNAAQAWIYGNRFIMNSTGV